MVFIFFQKNIVFILLPFFVGNRGLQTLMLSLRVFYSAAFFFFTKTIFLSSFYIPFCYDLFFLFPFLIFSLNVFFDSKD